MTLAKKDESVEVEVTNEEPLQVEVAEPEAEKPIVTHEGKTTLPPTTTEQEDLSIAGMRRMNAVEKTTKAIVTVSITAAVIYTQIHQIEAEILGYVLLVIVSAYYHRVEEKVIDMGHRVLGSMASRGH